MAGRRAIEIHATAILIGDAGLLIRGASGAGKSALALALMATAQGRGLSCALVGDDRVRLAVEDGRLVARGHPAIAGKIERRGIGVLEKPYASEAAVRLLIDLAPWADVERLPEGPDDSGLDHDGWSFAGLPRRALEGVVLPALRLPAGACVSDLALAILERRRWPDVRHF
ncbi:HPr kinase/phosphorylase [Methylocella sp.]|uniref:HPr kinase/phosphorylase n=1 Tax=Methylocella sp. TaxID=1978226 RepID=UPI003783C9AE